MAKKKAEPKAKPAPKPAPKASVPANKDGTGRFEVVAGGGKFWVFNPEGIRVSSGHSEVEANDLATKFNLAFRFKTE